MILDRQDGRSDRRGLCEDALEHFAIQGLAEAGVNHAHREALVVQQFRGLQRLPGQRAVGDDRGVGAGLERARLAGQGGRGLAAVARGT